MNLKKLVGSSIVAGSLALSSLAGASVSFDPESGTGFVGKGDVQLAFGWNNTLLQKHARDIAFTYDSTEEYSAVCTWTTGEGKKGEQTHTRTHRRTAGVKGSVAYDLRVKSQVTGFNLTGFGGTVESGDEVPVVGGPCPGHQGNGGVWESVQMVASSGGVLNASHAGSSVLIWSPAL